MRNLVLRFENNYLNKYLKVKNLHFCNNSFIKSKTKTIKIL